MEFVKLTIVELLKLCIFAFQDFYEYYSVFPPYQQLPNDSSMVFEPEDVIKRPGKLREKSSKSVSKNYLRNEVLIRNSDSGKGKFRDNYFIIYQIVRI